MEWEHLPEPDLRGRTIVMTGASDGLGREAALQLALWGARLVLAVRNRRKGEIVARRIVRETGRGDAVGLARIDLADLSSVRAAADEIAEAVGEDGIDQLLHVAGLVTRHRQETADGFEMMTGVNALAPLLLTELLLPLVRERIVVVASDSHTFGRIDPADPHFRTGSWSMFPAYGRSKLITMLWGRELSDHMRSAPAPGGAVDLQLVHPGWVLTNLQNATGSPRLDAAFTALTRPVAMTAQRGGGIGAVRRDPAPAARFVHRARRPGRAARPADVPAAIGRRRGPGARPIGDGLGAGRGGPGRAGVRRPGAATLRTESPRRRP